MKVSSIVAILTLMLTSCSELLPTVDFSVSPEAIEIYQEVSFTNLSTDADTYAWDFGDETTSTDMNPIHVYTESGTYTVKLVATNVDGDAEVTSDVVVADHENMYTLDDVDFAIDADMFWYQSSMGGDPYIRLITSVAGQDNPDLLKLYPNKGLNEIAGTYTWDADNPAGTYDVGYTANYLGMAYDWTAVGKTGSGILLITDLEEDVYKVEGTFILSVGSFDYATGEFTETSTADLVLSYVGAITPLL